MWCLLVSTNQIASEQIEEQIGIFRQFMDEFPQKALNFGWRVFLALLCFLIGVQIIKLSRKIFKKSMERMKADVGVIQFLDSLLKVVLYLVLLAVIASKFGFDATSVIAIVGSAGVAIGLALQGSLSNFAGGVLILLLKPFKVGDYIIEDSKKNEGTVSEIQLFYTKLTTMDDKVIVLPNGTLANTSLTNVTATYKRRLEIKVGISYEADLHKAKEIIEQILCDQSSVLQEEERMVFVAELAESSVIIGARCYVKNEDYFLTKCILLERIKLEFDKFKIQIPYKQLDIHLNRGRVPVEETKGCLE